MKDLDKIFKAYDIRGVYPKELNEEVAYKIGRAAAKFLNKEMIIGQDNRSSSKDLSKVLIEGIRDEGIDVIDIGVVTTPMFYFSAIKWKLKAGIMITASHNPPEYNGFKIIRDKAMPVGEGSGLMKIKEIVKKMDKNMKIKRGDLEKREILYDYINHVLDFVHIHDIKPLKLVIDTGKGTAGLIAQELFEQVPGKFIHISSNFLNPKNAKKIEKQVLLEKADLGVAFDGDGDRILFINEKGEKINPDLIAVVLIHYYFKNTGKILYTAASSHNIKEEINESNNIPIVSKVGHTFVKEKMEKEDIVFGSEPSGHYYLKDNYFIESPFIALLMILQIISKTGIPLSELANVGNYISNIERKSIKIHKNVGNTISNIEKGLKKKYKKYGKISRIDGLTIEFKDWWFNIRLSHTEPVLRLTIEAKTKELLQQKKKELLKLIQSWF